MDRQPLYSTVPPPGAGYGGAQYCNGKDLDTEWKRRFAVLAAEEGGLDSPALPKRRRLNGLALLECVLLPWGIFVGVMWVQSFSVHYDHVEAGYFLVACGLAISVGFFLKWLGHLYRSAEQEVDPSWFCFLAGTCFVAWLAALVLGNANFSGNMRVYYDTTSMGLSRNVDPRDIPGNHYLDASRMIFKAGSYVQPALSMGFKDSDTYCVAPIVLGNASTSRMASYDYWAVGINCCVPSPPASFWCGGHVDDTDAHAGLRWMSDAERPYFRLAIQQAEAEYGIRAQHPIFFDWTDDPVAHTEKFRTAGIRYFHACIWAHLVVQGACVVALALYYSRTILGALP